MIAGMTASSDGDLSGDHTSGDLWILEIEGDVNQTFENEKPQPAGTVTQEPAIGHSAETGQSRLILTGGHI
jgi:hypothetical protein